MLAHTVFFTLQDARPEARQALAEACRRYLAPHAGIASFAVGERASDLDRDVNDADFHVSLHVVFESREAHDAYQVAPDHLTFIEEQKANWAQVRVFDSLLPS